MAERRLPKASQMVFGSSCFIEPNREEPMRCRMDEFHCVMREVAKQYGALFVDTQDAFDCLVLRYNHLGVFVWDRDHSTQRRLLLAEACFKALQAAPDARYLCLTRYRESGKLRTTVLDNGKCSSV